MATRTLPRGGPGASVPTPRLRTAPAAGATDDEEEVVPYRWIILTGLITAAILQVLDSTIVNVALPQMAGNLGATSEEIGWVSTGYILSNIVVLPMTAWLSSRFGRRRYLLWSIFIFLVASFFCGTSRSLGELILWRIVQGAGGAALLSTAQATLREIFPRDMQGMVQAIYTLGVIVAPTLGPSLGGWITDNYSWPFVFFVNLPIGGVAMFLVATFLNDGKYRMHAGHVDWPGIILLAVGLGAMQYVLEEGQQDDWFQDAWILRLTVISVLALVGLIVWELWPANPGPVVNLRVLKNRELSSALVMFLALGFGLYGGVYLFPLFAQTVLGFSPTVTGLVLLPGGLGTGVSAIICGRLLNGRKALIDPKILIIAGMLLFIGSMWDLGHLTTQSGEPDTRIALMLRGFGLGLCLTPINLAAFSSLKGAEIAQGASMINLCRQLGGSFGIALLGTFVTNRTAVHRVDLIANVYSANPAVQERIGAYASAFLAHGMSPSAAQAAALGVVERVIDRQAMTMAYNDGYLLIGLATLLVTPLVFLLRNRPSGEGSVHVEVAAD